MKAILTGAAAAVAALLSAMSCVDTSALPFEEKPVSDAGADALWISTCDGCVRQEPSCGYATCAADPRCLGFYECTLDLGCYAPPVLTERISCGQPCFPKLGIENFQDPLFAAFFPISGCTIAPGKCASACVGGATSDASAGSP